MLRNVVFIYVIQGLSYLIPLFEIPLLARRLGPENYGVLLIVQSASLLASAIVEYGFNLKSSREIAEHKECKNKHSQIYWSVFSAKLILSMICLFFLIGFLFFKSYNKELVALGFLYFISFGFSVAWYYQGMGQLGFASTLDLFCRFISLISIYIFLPENGSAVDAMMYMASFSFASTLITNFFAIKRFGVGGISFKDGCNEIVKGFHTFIYKGVSVGVNAALPLFIGVTAGAKVVSNVISAEKIIRVVVGLINPLFLVSYPFFVGNRKSVNQVEIEKLAIISISFFALLLSITVAFFAEEIILFLLSKDFLDSVYILKFFCISIFFKIACQAFVYFYFLPRKEDWLIAKISILTGVSLFVIIFPLVKYFGVLGGVGSIVFSDGLAFLIYAWIFSRGKK